jgi:MinD superfamily P-loop ATPase
MRNKGFKIAVLSGKGGTGKTLVSVNLAAAAEKAAYIDCDVEEPNGHLFFKPGCVEEEEVTVNIPVIDKNLCTGCRKCVDFCRFNALALIKNQPVVFPEICHSCGGCALLCPEKAIREKKKIEGVLRKGVSGSVSVSTGILNTGEASGIPLIKKLLGGDLPEKEPFTLIDCPPGSACIVMESIREVDSCILVAEPTLFGVHNLGMVYELVRLFRKPHGVLLNKCSRGKIPPSGSARSGTSRSLGRIPLTGEAGNAERKRRNRGHEKRKIQKLFSPC